MEETGPKIVDRRRKPFVMVENWFIDVWGPKLGAEACWAYLVLLRFAGSVNNCFPGQKRVAFLSNKTEKTVRKSLAKLRAAGLISWNEQQHGFGGRKTTLEYTINDVPEADPQAVVHGVEQPAVKSTGGAGGRISPRTGGKISLTGSRYRQKKDTGEDLWSLKFSSLREEDLQNSNSVVEKFRDCDPVQLHRAAAMYAALERVASVGKIESRVALFRWLEKNPKSITQGDDDRATGFVGSVPVADVVTEIAKGLTWDQSSDSTTKNPNQSKSKNAK